MFRAEMDGDWCSIGPLRIPEEDWKDTFGEEIPLPKTSISLRITPPNGKRLSAVVVETSGFAKVIVRGPRLAAPRISLYSWNKIVPAKYRMKKVGDSIEFWLSERESHECQEV